MELNEREKWILFQVESTDRPSAIHELSLDARYARSQETRQMIEALLDKLYPLSDHEVMDMIRYVQKNYRLPEKPRSEMTLGELIAEARQQAHAEKLAGHDIMAVERFTPGTKHMIVFDVLSDESSVGWKGERMRLFLTKEGYAKALENQKKGYIRIRNHANVMDGHLHYDSWEMDL